jgi:hypothetical protein
MNARVYLYAALALAGATIVAIITIFIINKNEYETPTLEQTSCPALVAEAIMRGEDKVAIDGDDVTTDDVAVRMLQKHIAFNKSQKGQKEALIEFCRKKEFKDAVISYVIKKHSHKSE